MTDLPNPTPEQVALWLKNGLTRDFLHEIAWQDANKRFHGITRAVRPYIQANYKTPEEQEAAFDGLTLALAALSHFDDVEQLTVAWRESLSTSSATSNPTPKNK